MWTIECQSAAPLLGVRLGCSVFITLSNDDASQRGSPEIGSVQPTQRGSQGSRSTWDDDEERAFGDRLISLID